MNADTQDLYEQHERLQEALATRQSTRHFARAGVSAIVAFILGGATLKLIQDSQGFPYLGLLVGAVTLGIIIYGGVRYAQGRKALATELARFAVLLELRHRLKLDNPASLLPR